jgi:hypothetical protein
MGGYEGTLQASADPPFSPRWVESIRPGDRLKVVNPGFPLAKRKETVVSIPPIERVDYLALRQVGR